MPGLKEITYIQEKIKELGHEKEIADELDLLIKTSPEQLQVKESEKDKTENLVDNILDNFDQEMSGEENFDEISEDASAESTEDFLASLVESNEQIEADSDTTSPSSLEEEITTDKSSAEEITDTIISDEDSSTDDTNEFLSDLLGDEGSIGEEEQPDKTEDLISNLGDSTLSELEHPISGGEEENISMEVSDDLSDLAGDLGEEFSLDNLDNLGNMEESLTSSDNLENQPLETTDEMDLEELNPLETLDAVSDTDETITTTEEDKTDQTLPADIEDLEVLEGSAGEETKEIEDVLEEIGKEEETDANVSELNSILESDKGGEIDLDDELGDFSDLGLELGENKEEDTTETTDKTDDISLGLSNESIESLETGQDTNLEDQLVSGLEEIPDDELLESDSQKLSTEEQEDIEDLSSIGETDEFEIEDIGDIGEFGDELSAMTTDDNLMEGFDEIESGDQELKDFTMGEIPDEISESDLAEDQDVDIELTDEERKQVIISLSSLPKKAEITIAKAIISNKYSNKKLKPLIDALIANEKPSDIIHLYQTITKDNSLAHVLAYKYTGEEFDKKQKSFIYSFQKNILPILSRIAVSAIVLLAIVLLFVRLIFPTMEASKNYRIGRRHIIEKKFGDVDQYFDKAFRIQPRFNEVIKYARLFRQYKRYKETEKKYALALAMKPYNKPTRLELADFYREKGDYERASKIYNGFLKINYRDIPVLLGLAHTLMDWSNINKSKLDKAEQIYLDILDINRNNKEALFGNLSIQLKRKNHKKIMQYYDYINKKLKNNIDPFIYADLAKYFIDRSETKNIKDIIKKAYSMEKKLKEIIPEIDYQNSRYLKMLDVSKEEEKYLNNALIKLKQMKNNPKYQEKYESKKYQRLLALVHNALGENYNRTSPGDIKAEKEFLLAKNIDPNIGKPYFNLGNFALHYKDDRPQALSYYEQAEQHGYIDDKLDFNMGWLYYKKKDFYKTYIKISGLLDKYPYNSNLKFMLATTLYKLKRYQLAESLYLENYIHFNDLMEQFYPLDMENKDSIIILEMLKKISNNLGATFQKRYELTRQNKLLVKATKYYSESILYFDKLNDNDDKLKDKANQNLRMVLYPDTPKDEPFLFEDFPLNYKNSK